MFKGGQFPLSSYCECFLAIGLLVKSHLFRGGVKRVQDYTIGNTRAKARDFIDMANQTQAPRQDFFLLLSLGIWAVRDNILADLSISISGKVVVHLRLTFAVYKRVGNVIQCRCLLYCPCLTWATCTRLSCLQIPPCLFLSNHNFHDDYFVLVQTNKLNKSLTERCLIMFYTRLIFLD